jgi:ribonuclease D
MEEVTPAESENVALPLLAPAGGTPQIVTDLATGTLVLQKLAAGTGPFALDTERASGYRFSARAYLIQIKRTNGGLHLIDPIAFSDHPEIWQEFNQLFNTDEVILHASTQDLPCLRELGISPTRLFDTELGARIAGLPRVGLGPLVESLLGYSLAKEHSAVDWSMRPLAQDWLTYAALDVELLIELRDNIASQLEAAGKLQWAMEEFASILAAPPPEPRRDPWRRTSGMHKIKSRKELAIVEALWRARLEIAQESDIAPGRLLNDSAIVELAVAAPVNRKAFEKALRPLGVRPKWMERYEIWQKAILDVLAAPENTWPPIRVHSDAVPPTKVWRDKFPAAYAPFTHARAAIAELSQRISIPVENILQPEALRKLCWERHGQRLSAQEVTEYLLSQSARAWQCALVADLLIAPLQEKTPLLTEANQPENGPVAAPEV